MLAARTNYRMQYPDYREAGADPAAAVAKDAAIQRPRSVRPILRAATGMITRHCSAACALRLEPAASEAAHRQAARAVRHRQCGARSPARTALFPVRPLPADRLFARGFAAREPAGRVERQGHAAVERRLPRQHQPADELLAGGSGESRRDHAAAVRFRRSPRAARQARRAALLRRERLDDVPQHQRLGIRRSHRLAHGVLAARGLGVARPAFLRALSIQPGRWNS